PSSRGLPPFIVTTKRLEALIASLLMSHVPDPAPIPVILNAVSMSPGFDPGSLWAKDQVRPSPPGLSAFKPAPIAAGLFPDPIGVAASQTVALVSVPSGLVLPSDTVQSTASADSAAK